MSDALKLPMYGYTFSQSIVHGVKQNSQAGGLESMENMDLNDIFKDVSPSSSCSLACSVQFFSK